MTGFPAAALPNIRHLRAFAAVAQTGSVTRAAERVHLSQSAVTQAITSLEKAFGGPLFENRKSGAALTARGDIVLKRVRRGLGLIAAADERLTGDTARPAGADSHSLSLHATVANLRAIVAVASAGSFSAAARRLGVSEPAVNRAARALERALGVALLESRASGVGLTRKGRTLAAYAGRALSEFAGAIDEIGELEGRFEGTVAIGTLPLLRTAVVPRAVVDTVARYPKANVQIHEGSYDALIAALDLGEIDVVLGALRPQPPHGGLEQSILFSDGLSIVARARHPLLRRRKIEPQDLRDYPWVVPLRGTPTRRIFDEAVATGSIVVGDQGLIETGSVVTLRGILVRSDCLTVVSRAQISPEEAAGWLAVLPIALTGTERPLGMITRTGWRPTSLQSAFLAALRAAVARETKGGSGSA